MGPDEWLVIAMALPPVLLTARLWWYVAHTGEGVRDYSPLTPWIFDDAAGPPVFSVAMAELP